MRSRTLIGLSHVMARCRDVYPRTNVYVVPDAHRFPVLDERLFAKQAATSKGDPVAEEVGTMTDLRRLWVDSPAAEELQPLMPVQ